jgi:regulator of replication initiation timing
MKSLQAQVEGQKEKLNELQSENMELQSHKRKLQELLNGEKQVKQILSLALVSFYQ